MPVRVPVFECMDTMRDHLRAQGLLHRPEDVLVMVAPDVAAELYVWAWRVRHPRCFAWPPAHLPWMATMGSAAISRRPGETDDQLRVRAACAPPPARVPYELVDLIGKIDEYPVLVRGYLDPGHLGLLPYGLLAENDRTMTAVMEAKARRTK
jgi:hypothetical protein